MPPKDRRFSSSALPPCTAFPGLHRVMTIRTGLREPRCSRFPRARAALVSWPGLDAHEHMVQAVIGRVLGQEQRLNPPMQRVEMEVFHNADHGRLGGVVDFRDRQGSAYWIGPSQDVHQAFIDDGRSLGVRCALCVEISSRDQLNPERGQVAWVDPDNSDISSRTPVCILQPDPLAPAGERAVTRPRAHHGAQPVGRDLETRCHILVRHRHDDYVFAVKTQFPGAQEIPTDALPSPRWQSARWPSRTGAPACPA